MTEAWPPCVAHLTLDTRGAPVPYAQACLSAMMQLEIPHINVLTKVDLLKKNKIPYKQCARAAARTFCGELSPLCFHSRGGTYFCPVGPDENVYSLCFAR